MSEDGLHEDGLRHSAVPPPPGEAVALDGWLVSGRAAGGRLRLVDCSPVTKLIVQAPPAGLLAGQLAVPVGRAEMFEEGLLIACTAPGEWLVLCPYEPESFLTSLGDSTGDEPSAVLDVTDGRTLLRLTGPDAADLLAGLCEVDLSDATFGPGSATYAPLAGVRTGLVRDDLFADEAGWPAAEEPPRGEDGMGGADRPGPSPAGQGPSDPDVPSYLLHCDRSAGRFLYDQLLGAGAALGLEEEGFAPWRARRAEL